MPVVINEFEVIPGGQAPKPEGGENKPEPPRPIVIAPTPAAMNDAHRHAVHLATRAARVRAH